MKFIIILLFTLSYPNEYSDPVGIYSATKGSSTMWSTTVFTIECDQSVVITKKTHSGTDSYTGTWKMSGDTVKIKLDSIMRDNLKILPKSFGEVNQFIVKKTSLRPVVTEINGDKIHDEKLLKKLNKNLQGDHLKKVKNITCY